MDIVKKFENIKIDVMKLVFGETQLKETIQELQSELSVYKKIFNDSTRENQSLKDEYKKLKQDFGKQCEGFEKQLQASRVVVLVDGDWAIFYPQLVSQGQVGGDQAASKLSDYVTDHILLTREVKQFQLWVYIFFNKRGLADTLGRHGHRGAQVRLDDFIIGFNQAAEWFLMVDVGNGKEITDAKIKCEWHRYLDVFKTCRLRSQPSLTMRFDYLKHIESLSEVAMIMVMSLISIHT